MPPKQPSMTVKSSYNLWIGLVLFVWLLFGVFPAGVRADDDPTLTIVASSTVSGVVAEATSIPISLSGTSATNVPVKLVVTHGTLSMTTTTGLTFTGPTSGSTLQFTGSLANVNSALATLSYTRGSSGSDTLEISLVEPGEVFFAGTGNLYEYIAFTGTWQEAEAHAQTLTRYGATGYLTTITSAEENNFVSARLEGAGWMGASDVDTEGDWKWVTGPEAGTSFWSGAEDGSAVGGAYENWNSGEPNDFTTGEDCGQFLAGASGQWNDLPCTGIDLAGYVAEFGQGGDEVTVVADTVAITTTVNPPPSISTLSPSDNAVDVAVDGSLVITFSEVVDAETGTISIKKASDDSTVEEFDVTTDITGSGTDEITINPTTDLPYETELYVHIDATAFDDTASNSFAGITDATTWNFTTEDTPACPSIANAATYNTYPACGIATCTSGYSLSDGQCVIDVAGASLPPGALNPPEPPQGGFGVMINNNNPTTNNPQVTLQFQAGPDTTTMALSRNPDFVGATIEPYQPTKAWNLNPSNLACADNSACTSGEYTVYARFYTQWGVVSPTVTDTISLTDTVVSTFTACEVTAIPDQAIRYGVNNNPADVRLLEQFLNTFEGFDLVVDGAYSQADRDAVVMWQERHAADILAPWNLTEGTGYVFRTSLAKMQEIVEAACQETTKETPQPSSTSDYSFTRNLYLGLSGEDVRNLQRYLNVAGYVIASEGPGSPGQETDFFGSLTRSAVIDFQRDHNISPAVGYFGPVTRGVVEGG